MSMKISILKSFILLAAMVLPFLALAQPVDPSDAYVPLDGGLSLLLAAGIGYGAKKAIQARKKN
jgi:hypothetical protein